jgi:hypothetical protein
MDREEISIMNPKAKLKKFIREQHRKGEYKGTEIADAACIQFWQDREVAEYAIYMTTGVLISEVEEEAS